MTDEDAGGNPFDRLQLERKRTLFIFYGWRTADGRQAEGPYSKQAHSLSEALGDLEANPGVAAEGGIYLVRDAFLEEDEAGATLHVELVFIANSDLGLED